MKFNIMHDQIAILLIYLITTFTPFSVSSNNQPDQVSQKILTTET